MAAGSRRRKVIAKRPRRAPWISRRYCACCGIARTIDGTGAQLTLMEIETPGGQSCRPMPCHRRIDEFFDGSGNCAMIGSVPDGTFGSGESRIMLEYVVPIKAPVESPQIRTLPVW